jgi:hypothetical protein
MGKKCDAFLSVGPSGIVCLNRKDRTIFYEVTRGEKKGGDGFNMAFGVEGGVNIKKAVKLIVGVDYGVINRANNEDCRVSRNILHLGMGYIF